METAVESANASMKVPQSMPVLGQDSGMVAKDGETESFQKQFEQSLRAGPTRKLVLKLIPLDFTEGLLGLGVLLLWIVVFASGIVIPTEAYRNVLGQNDIGLAAGLGALFYVVTCYTVTNVALLACLSGFLGGLARRAKIAGDVPSAYEEGRMAPGSHDYLTAVMRGFFIYLVVLSGLILMTTQAITSPTQDQYIRLAGTISVVSFIAGYDPQMFSRILMKVTDMAQGQRVPTEKQTTSEVQVAAKQVTKETPL